MSISIQYVDMDDINVETPRDEFNFWHRAEQTAANP